MWGDVVISSIPLAFLYEWQNYWYCYMYLILDQIKEKCTENGGIKLKPKDTKKDLEQCIEAIWKEELGLDDLNADMTKGKADVGQEKKKSVFVRLLIS